MRAFDIHVKSALRYLRVYDGYTWIQNVSNNQSMIVILCIQYMPAHSDRTQSQHLKSSFLICWDTLLSENIIPEMLDNQTVLGPWKAVQR